MNCSTRRASYKERLSQSALVAAMRRVSDEEARDVRGWLDQQGMKFKTGPNPETDLTDEQILEQCKMYIAAVRIAHDFGCAAIGIQYQQGLKDLAAGLRSGRRAAEQRRAPAGLPCRNRPGVVSPARPLPHFNEVDEGAGLDALVTNRVWTAMGFDPATTLHDLRWGEHYAGPDGLGRHG